ncbi:DNA repair protein RecN (Recombination protein N) [Alkalihalobacillus xiaoxiensis]|uniref:DNA repair protein RecN n=1 Tax=Shouchella xiaoxiensis TaxID=766895 RepID=A0ABS2SXN4_9BACI|nr:DNA repair protein RecN [Shouchella xiaoxiensis]MBM7840293.1 DNA repair protein RecN (Recombination protein N) [Shouchella xiaoxiensis]
MLMELSIKNFAIISSLTIPFEKGLTVLTGETGAGKSIIIDAIGLLLGGRGSTEFVRYGEKRAEIEGLFSLEDNHPVLAKLESLGIDVEEGMLVLRRDMTDTGKSICRMNGKLMTIGSLREVGQTLIDVHGQHEHQSLMRTEEHLELLDSFGDASLKKALSEYGKLFKQLTIINRRIAELDRNAQDIAQKTDLYTYQLGEITQANLIPNEDVQLLADRKKLANGEKLAESLTRSYEHLYGENKGLDYLNGMLSHLEAATSLDEDLKPLYEQVSSSYYLFEEASYSIREALDQVEFNPTALEQIELRLSEIDKLKRKYGQTVEEIVDYAQKLEDELEVMENIDERVNELKVEQRALLEDLDIEANAISNMRRSVASQLEKAIKKQLQSLYMEKTSFQVQISQLSELHKNGQDQIEFLLSTNPGEPLKPLAKVASGGEISRIMLALKSIFSTKQGITSVIFDEVDTGVSGRVAQAIAEKIQGIAKGSQVLCITHLPQVAAMADNHLFILKEENKERVKTKVMPLSDDQKVEEVARMLSGVEVTEITLENAKELLNMAKKKKHVH